MTFCYSLRGQLWQESQHLVLCGWLRVSSSNVTIMSDHRGNKSYEPHRVGLDLQINLCSDPHYYPKAPGETSTSPQGDWLHSQLSSAEGPHYLRLL